MAKSPVANDPEAARSDRRTRIASGPVPVPLPVPPPVGKAPMPAGVAPSRKTQVIMGAPPIPPPVTGKTVVPSGPKPPSIPSPAAVAPPKSIPATPVPDGSLPSYQETVIGPAPAPPVIPPSVPASAPPSALEFAHEKTAVGLAPRPPQAESTAKPRPEASDAEMDALIADSLFDDFDGDDLPSAAPRRVDDTLPAPSGPRGSSGPIPIPPRPSGPAPAAKGTRDTLPNAELRTGATFPPARQAAAIADTQIDIDRPPTHEDPVRQRPTTGVRPVRASRARTQNQGAEGLAVPSSEVPKIRLVPGKVIPGTRYEIRRWLGEGGMGVVYEVVHTDIDRRSALKILRFDLSQQPQMAQVFRDEARAASRLGSPNIVEVYDFGELPDGRLFFAMELLEGEDLVPADEQTSMDLGRFVGIMRQVCKGLYRAHEAGVVHRDVKPENIIISKIEGRADHVKIVDFGISAMLAAGEQRIGIAGTPHYMAPEQILGQAFDGRLDVYALGCTAYELLVGKPPFDHEEIEVVLKQQVSDTPPPIRQLRPDLEIPAALEAVVLRCLAKEPADRYQDMADLEAALCEAQIAAGIVTPWDDLPVPPLADDERRQQIIARMPSRDLMLPPRRGWLWPTVAITSTLAAGGLTAFLLFGHQPSEAEKDLVEQLTIEARDAASKLAWVVPPPHLDSDSTALIKVSELEALDGSAEKMAVARGEELRHEFAGTLVAHGDQLWEGSREIARQYYAWSLLFEPNDQAFARAEIDMMTLDTFRRRALAGEFNEAERLIAGVVTYEVVEDPEAKAALVVAMNEGLEKADSLSPMTRVQIERQAKSAGVELRGSIRGSGVLSNDAGRSNADRGGNGSNAGSAGSGGNDASDPGSDEDVLVDDPGLGADDPTSDDGRKNRRRKVDLGLSGKKGSFDPARSNELTEQADAKRKQGLRNEAKSLYGQAIAANPSNGDAHLGMALVHFDQGSYHQARKAAEQAVKHAPRNGRAYKTLGDALYKEFHYQDAEDAYMEAQRLGVNIGTRLTEVRKKKAGAE